MLYSTGVIKSSICRVLCVSYSVYIAKSIKKCVTWRFHSNTTKEDACFSCCLYLLVIIHNICSLILLIMIIISYSFNSSLWREKTNKHIRFSKVFLVCLEIVSLNTTKMQRWLNLYFDPVEINQIIGVNTPLQRLFINLPGSVCAQFNFQPLGGASCYNSIAGWESDWGVSAVLYMEHTCNANTHTHPTNTCASSQTELSK